MSTTMVRTQARQLLSMAMTPSGQIDEQRILEIVRELMRSSIPAKREIARELGVQAQSYIEAHRAIVTTANPLDGPTTKELSAIIQKKFPQVVDLEWRVDPTLIAGVTITIGDMWYDASVANDLSKIKERLIQ